MEHPTTYIPLIRKWYEKDTTYKVNLSFIMGIFKYNKQLQIDHASAFEKWGAAFKSADGAVNDRYESNAPTERQVQGYVPYDKIIKARDELPPGSINRLLLGMYTHLRPMRCEYARVAIYKTKPPASSNKDTKDKDSKDKDSKKEIEDNYILLNRGRLIIRHFKTRKHHEGYDIAIPKPLMEDLKASLVETPREWLFVNANGNPYSPALFSQWTMRVFKSVFKKPLTVALIRHSYINTLDFNQLSVAEKKEIALSMGHTVGTQDRYRLIFDTNNDTCT
jgi:hypothetical protein